MDRDLGSRTVFIVHAHGDRDSFNAALTRVAVETLTRSGYEVIVSDLHSMNFMPVYGRDESKNPLQNLDHCNHNDKDGVACTEPGVTEDVKVEQNKIMKADLVIFQFPLYWMGLPAILKGWFDRVFTEHFAFTDEEFYDNGKLKGKRAILSFTTGAPQSFFTARGPHGDVNVMLWPLQHGILRYVGFDVLAPFISYAPQFISHESRTKILKRWEERLGGVFREDPLYFIPISKFSPKDPDDPTRGLELTDSVIAELQTDGQHGLTVGQHFGRKLPEDSMTK